MQLGTFSITSAGASDGFVAKLDPSSDVLWAKRFGSSETEGAEAVIVDASGSVYVSAIIAGPTDFGDGVLHSPGGQYDVALAKLDASGKVLWSRSWGNPVDNDWPYAMTVHPGGGVILGGVFSTVIEFSPLAALAGGTTEGFVVHVDATGTPSWNHAVAGNGNQRVLGLASDDDRFYATSSLDGTLTIGGVQLGAPGKHAVLTAFDYSGQALWSRNLATLDSSSEYEVGRRPGVLPTGGVVVPTSFEGTTVLDGVSHTSMGEEDILVAAFDADNKHLWSKSFGTTADEEYARVAAVDASGAVIVAGTVKGPWSCGGELMPTSSTSEDDTFLISFAPTGDVRWCRTWGGSGDNSVTALRYDASGILAAGWFSGVVTFPGQPSVSSGGSEDAMIFRFHP
jgi:hypothetical protein